MDPWPKLSQLLKRASQRRGLHRGSPPYGSPKGAAEGASVPGKSLAEGERSSPPPSPRKSWPVRPDTGSLTGDAARHVHSHGDSKAKTQVDTKKAPKLLLSQNHMSHGTKTKYL